MHTVGRLISIVDDDLSVRRALGRLVKVAGYSVETFASAHEFLASSAAERTTCLITA
jgi:FixJ family two-component response regulator